MKLIFLFSLIVFNILANDNLPLNFYQTKGTHNSYHVKPWIRVSSQHNYSHKILTEQLRDHVIRQLELDLNVTINNKLKVNHLPLVDAKSTCKYLKDCLIEIKKWSDSNPNHFPLMIWLEPKINPIYLIHPLYKKFKLKHLHLAEKEIEEILGEKIFHPRDLIRNKLTIRETLRQFGWPTLSEMKGKIIIGLLNYEDLKTAYLKSKNIDEMSLFTRSIDINDPYGAFAKEGSCDRHHLDNFIKNNFINTSRSESITDNNQYARELILKCIKNGAHILSGDNPTEEIYSNEYFPQEFIINQRALEILN